SDGVNTYHTEIDYDGIQNVVVNGGHGANTLIGPSSGSNPQSTLVMPLGGSGDDEIYGMATDSAGNLYLAGYFQATVDFDPGPGVSNLTTTGIWDVFVAKYTSTGALVWAR